MAYTTIDDPSKYFQTTLWAGNTTAPRSITNSGNSNLQPDIVWGKNRSTNGTDHFIYDSSRGTGTSYSLQPNTSNAEGTATTYGILSAFQSNGFQVNAGGTNDDNWNENGSAHVAWQWKVNGGTTVSNTDGNITSTVQANQTSGVSIVTYTGQGTQTGKTVGHGLGKAPRVILSKDRDAGSNVPNWRVYIAGDSLNHLKYGTLDTEALWATFNDWDNTAPTSTVYSVGGSGGYTPTNTSGRTYLAYCFTDIKGFSKFGHTRGNSSTGNDGNADDTFVYCGFKPALVIYKQATDGTANWEMIDTARDTRNPCNNRLFPSSTGPESSAEYPIDILSTGFKMRDNYNGIGSNGTEYVYFAWAEHPFVSSNGTPTTAR